MARRSDAPTRHEVTDTVDKNKDDMREKETCLDAIAADLDTVRRTLDSLDLGATADGADEVEHAMHGAEDVTADAFDRDDDQLEQIQSQTEEHEGELSDRSATSESDMGKINDAGAAIETSETAPELEKAADAALREIDFLKDHMERERAARAESDRVQQDLQARVRAGRRR